MGSLLCSDMRDGERREVGRDSLRGPGATRRADRLNALGRCMRSEGSSVGRRSPVCPRLHAESLDAVPAIDAALGEEHSGAEKRLPSRLIRQCSLCAGGPLYLGTAQHQLHIAEHPAGHLVLKWLIEQDEKMKENGREGVVQLMLADYFHLAFCRQLRS
ncbi:hypothetical protein CB1_000723002 [Camelus ferus]|nr:hypothetical protein CB1_000723002 [Camelus ferus]